MVNLWGSMFSNDSNICIFGMRGAGKSTLCRRLQAFFPNIFIFDTLKEYDESYGHVFYDYETFSEFVIETADQNGVIAIIRFNLEDSLQSEFFDDCIRLIYYRGNATIVIEEVQNFANVHKLPHFLKQASLTGRHQDIGFITTTQRIAEIHKSLLSQAHHIFAGYCDNPNDKKTLKEYGFPLDKIEQLNQFEFIWKDGKELSKVDNSLNFISEKTLIQDDNSEIVDENAENLINN